MNFSIELPVQFRDLDSLGHVNSAVYLQYMETTRIEFMRALGRISHGFQPRFIIASCRCDYQSPIVDERKIRISMWVGRIGGRSWDFEYSVNGLDGTKFAIGRTTQVAYNYEKRASTPIDDELRRDLGRYYQKPLKFLTH